MKKFKQQHMNVEVTKLKTEIETIRKRKTESCENVQRFMEGTSMSKIKQQGRGCGLEHKKYSKCEY